MRLPLLLALLLAPACAAKDHNPIGDDVGGDDGVGDDGDDDGEDDDDGGTGALVGRVCVVADLRRPATCAATDTGGVSVVGDPGEGSDTAGSNGSFSIAEPGAATVLEIADGDASFRPARVPIAAWSDADGEVRAPLVTRGNWDDLIEALLVVEPDDSGSIAVYVRGAGGAAMAGATVDAVAGAVEAPRYGGVSAQDWTPGIETGSSGAVLIIGVPAGAAEVTARKGGAETSVTVPVRPGTVTFASIRL